MTHENLDLFGWAPPEPEPERPSIDSRWVEFRRSNPHVFAEALRLARDWLAKGERYISTKKILEVLRTSVETTGDQGYRINNDFSATIARDLLTEEPRLIGVLRLRRRKGEL